MTEALSTWLSHESHSQPISVFPCIRNTDEDRRAASFPRFDFEMAASERCPLAHADQSESAMAWLFSSCVDLESSSVVFDDEHGLVVAAVEQDRHMLGLRVLDDVVQRFLNHPIETGLDLPRQAMLLVARHIERGRDAESLGPPGHKIAQCRRQSKMVERGRSEVPREEIDA